MSDLDTISASHFIKSIFYVYRYMDYRKFVTDVLSDPTCRFDDWQQGKFEDIQELGCLLGELSAGFLMQVVLAAEKELQNETSSQAPIRD